MTQTGNSERSTLYKVLSIVGFLLIIVVIAWLSVQFIRVVPSAFSSLASLAEGLNQYQSNRENTEGTGTTFAVTSNKTVVDAGDTVIIDWEETDAKGTYTFAYTCTDGVAVAIVEDDGNRNISCDTEYNIGDTNSLILEVDSEKDRYADLSYSLAFYGLNDRNARATGGATIALMNQSISDLAMGDEEERNEPTEETPVSEPETEVTEPETPVTPPSTPTTPTYGPATEIEYIYEIPVSNPNGEPDLTTRFLGVGSIIGNRFFPGRIEQDEAGAIQFEVRNIGTKTSDEWTFEVALPGGANYESPDQTPLKPNETAVLTIGFMGDNDSSHTFRVDIVTDEDRNYRNNDFSQSVRLY